ncbi:hypothetical protein OEB99_05755 [Actinotalea sp. M2MS4P-6]|uniref:hypothetical protein n=1 Tax=Actinotalea sp. M2MS4P-6 TaxID=2983762 RepID=UPI0021E3AC20|nr:hypothetical protein [Actinotalea sp. M2MS4P-6]MCV2393808.1 hypothetical protein [Actinotalea sp. M2MS4P-6]
MESGVAVMIVATFSAEKPESAEVYSLSDGSHGEPLWSGYGYTGTPGNLAIVRFDERDWGIATGDYREAAEYGLAVRTNARSYGSGVGGEFYASRDDLEALPADAFLVDGQQMSVEEYLEYVAADRACPSTLQSSGEPGPNG